MTQRGLERDCAAVRVAEKMEALPSGLEYRIEKADLFVQRVGHILRERRALARAGHVACQDSKPSGKKLHERAPLARVGGARMDENYGGSVADLAYVRTSKHARDASEGTVTDGIRIFAEAHRGRWGDRWDSNPQQPESQSGTLPLSYGHHSAAADFGLLVACPARLELTTPSLEGWCSIRLSYGQPGQPANLVGVA